MISDGKLYDPFRFGYTTSVARQGHVWHDAGIPIVDYAVTHEEERPKYQVPFFLNGNEHLTTERYLCEANEPVGFAQHTINTSGGGKDAGGLGTNPALCYEFADMTSTEKNFQAFTDKWGLLETTIKLAPPGWRNSRMDIGEKSPFEITDAWPSAIALSDLEKAHRELRFASVLWRLLDHGNLDRIREIFRIGRLKSDEGLICAVSDSRELNGDERGESPYGYDVRWKTKERVDEMAVSKHSELFYLTESGDITPGAMIVLNRFINRNVSQRVETRTILRRDARGLIPSTRATSLLGALWLQLFMAVCGERPLRRCEICGEWDLKRDLRQGKYHRRCWDREYRKAKREQPDE